MTLNKKNDQTMTVGDAAFQAAKSGDLSALLALLSQGGHPDVLDRHGFTALNCAAQFDRRDIIQILLNAGANPNALCKWGITPLMAAKNAETVELLLAAGGELNAVTQFNRSGYEPAQTALMKASQRGNLPVVEVLLAHGADMEMRDSEGRTALIHAAANQHHTVVKTLIEAGAAVGLVEAALLGNVAQVTAFLRTGADQHGELMARALWWASGNGQAGAAGLLLDAGADINAQGCRGITVLMHAALMGQMDVVKMLIARGANVNTRDRRGVTALHLSLSSSHGRNPGVVRALLEAGAAVNQRTRYSWPTHTGGTALMEAALHGATECARVLIEYGADLEISSERDDDGVGGWTALLAAVANHRLDIVRLLIESGADVNNGGNAQMPPLEMAQNRAKRSGEREIITLLVSAGAVLTESK